MRSRSLTWPIAASHNIFLLTRQRRLSGWYSSGSVVSRPVQAQRRRAMVRHGVAFYARWRLPYPAYVRNDLPLIYSPFLLKLPVLTASKSLRHSRRPWQSQARQAQRRRAVRFRARGGADGGINALSGLQDHHPGPPLLRQRRANVAYTGVTLASFASRVRDEASAQQDRPLKVAVPSRPA